MRLSLAKAFFAPGMLPTHLSEFVQTGWPTIIVQVAGPVLLAAGLWVRPVALLMLMLTCADLRAAADEHAGPLLVGNSPAACRARDSAERIG